MSYDPMLSEQILSENILYPVYMYNDLKKKYVSLIVTFEAFEVFVVFSTTYSKTVWTDSEIIYMNTSRITLHHFCRLINVEKLTKQLLLYNYITFFIKFLTFHH